MSTLNLTLIIRQSCGTDVVMSSKEIKFSAQKNCKVNLSSYNSTDQNLKEVRIMSLQKQFEYDKGLFMYNKAQMHI